MALSAQGALHVLIVHFNTPELTSRLIVSIPRQTLSGRSILVHVLDNASTSENLAALRRCIEGRPGVALTASSENVGFGAGMNMLAAADAVRESDILWLLNPDTRLLPGCIESLEAELDSGYFAIVSPLICSGDEGNPSIWYCGGTVSPRDLRVKLQLYGCELTSAPQRPYETEFMAGSAPMMFASTFRAVGGFPKGYFLYWEDVYFSWRASSLGLRLGIVPSARLWHAVGASSGSGQSRTFYYWSARHRFAFARDTGIRFSKLFVGRGLLESLRPIAKALVTERDSRFRKASAAIRGTIDGLRRPHT